MSNNDCVECLGMKLDHEQMAVYCTRGGSIRLDMCDSTGRHIPIAPRLRVKGRPKNCPLAIKEPTP